MKYISLVGQRFGRLTVVDDLTSEPGKKTISLCKCDCGKTVKVRNGNLRSGESTSCGCYRSSRISKINRRHGEHGSPTYKSWCAMLSRCSPFSTTRYPKYIGVKVCERWKRYENFVSDMGERPAGKSLDRFPNRKGNYEPGNCRWADATEQTRNRSVTKIVTVCGTTGVLADLCDLFTISYKIVNQRIFKGWSVEDALTRRVAVEKRR